MELSPIFFVAAATVAAAFVAALVSLVGLVISKEQKTTEFRQAWINSLRTEVAKFAAEARYISSAIQYAKSFDPNCFARDSKAYDTYAENRASIANAYYLISLHFKPNDADFDALSRLLDGIMNQLRHPNRLTFDATATSLKEITALVRSLMKKEWERVKAGENIYKWTKNAAIGLVVVFFLAIVVAGAIALKQALPLMLSSDPFSKAAQGQKTPR